MVSLLEHGSKHHSGTVPKKCHNSETDRMDLRLQGALEEDETLRRINGRDFKDLSGGSRRQRRRLGVWLCLAWLMYKIVQFFSGYESKSINCADGACLDCKDPKASAALRLYQDRCWALGICRWSNHPNPSPQLRDASFVFCSC